MSSDSQGGPGASWTPYIIMDTQDPYRIAPFWCGLLGVEVAQDRDEGQFVTLAPSPSLPGSIVLVLQKVSEPKVGKNRVHFDVIVDDLEDATKRVEELGGGRWSEHASSTVDNGGLISRIMVDPEGNEFCLVLSPSKADEWQPGPDEVVVRDAGRVVRSE